MGINIIMKSKGRYFATVCLLLLMFALIGCKNSETNSFEFESKSNNLISIQPIEIEAYTERDPMEINPPKNVSRVKIKIKNLTDYDIGVGSLDFKGLNEEGNEVDLYGYADNLGTILDKNSEIIGYLYYIEKVDGIKYLEYTSTELKETITWRLND